ncbi:M48 family peptidase [Segetibacter sp. 3557_3]|uniref:M48 family metallopeptidase n=1 Tax=Segetibacter sp. 3557_3 TaxID=2547429 RepID=UPI001058A46F|nr:M48 family metallopeptidase [Segetibacter sp. 3557_3]TDH21600.1 M48 family peptidase [Segetibacter sp. 3557_3]
MKRSLTLVTIAVSMLAIACATNAITGRRQLSLVPENELQSMAKSEYQQFLSQNKVVSSSQNKDAEMVRRVGSRIATAITTYYKGKGLANELQNYQWEYNLVDSKDVNAWCMPGGKIVVYTGLLPVTQNEAALAVVVGHEVAHAVAKHGSERMSQGLLQQLGGTALSVALSSKPAETQNLFMQAYGIGSQVGVMLPHSRSQELEADKLGLIYAALAGYNPREAIPLWQRMEAMANGSKPPEFLSTHPSEQSRIAKLQQQMPEALKYYQPMGK